MSFVCLLNLLFNIFCVSLTRYDCPVILTILALWQSLSTNAEHRTLSLIISSHLVKGRLVVMIMARVPVRMDIILKSSSAPSLSNPTYPISSQMTRSYFLKRFSNCCSVLSVLATRISVSRCGTVVKKTLYPSIIEISYGSICNLLLRNLFDNFWISIFARVNQKIGGGA